MGIKPSSDELACLYKRLSEAGKPALLSLIPGYCEAYVSLYERGILPQPLTELYQAEFLNMTYPDLLIQCEESYNNITITQEEAKNVEEKTRDQVRSKIWFQQRSGRITASKFKAAAHTDVTQPSQSLIKAICYPDNHQFRSQATAWGCEHEETGRKAYMAQMAKEHPGFCVCKSGLVVHPSYPHMGASPDGLIRCECCGPGVLEVKCPFLCKDKSFMEAIGESFFLEQTNGKFILKEKHAYYYQVQAQIKFCCVNFCDFVVWRENELVIQRIYPDEEFMSIALEKATLFFKLGVLPELLGKWYSKAPVYLTTDSARVDSGKCDAPQSSGDHQMATEVWCFCRQKESGQMIACDSEQCPITWFHTSCLKMNRIPKGKWFCPECRKTQAKRKSHAKQL